MFGIKNLYNDNEDTEVVASQNINIKEENESEESSNAKVDGEESNISNKENVNTATNKLEWVKWDVGLSFGDFSGGVSNFENLNVNYILNSNEELVNDMLLKFSNSNLLLF